MLHWTLVLSHRGGRSRHFIHRDPTLRVANAMAGKRNLLRMGVVESSRLWTKTGIHGHLPYQHAFPLLSHDDLGHSDQSNKTQHILLSSYMPKRNKGTAPWFRGADTYSVKYSEQGRFEYQRYLMISKFPSDFKRHFMRFLNNIRAPRRSAPSGTLPQEALHWLQRMIIDNFNPQHVHYVAAMQTLLHHGECDMARDVWKVMERQQTLPDDKCIVTYLEVCAAAREKTWAFECWNRYCTEKAFLRRGEVDPKPVSRVPFSLTREELLYLPKWKKHFDHDPNLDVPDLNRFNTTRDIYLKMALVMLSSGDEEMFSTFFGKLEQALLSTPSPIPEPPNPHFVPVPQWAPHEEEEIPDVGPWRMQNTKSTQPLGPSVTSVLELHPRFFSNEQFLVHSTKEALLALTEEESSIRGSFSSKLSYGEREWRSRRKEPSAKEAEPLEEKGDEKGETTESATLQTNEVKVVGDSVGVAERLLDGLFHALRTKIHCLVTESLLCALLQLYRTVRKDSGTELHRKAQAFMQRKAEDGKLSTAEAEPGTDVATESELVQESLTSAVYLEILKGFADEAVTADASGWKQSDPKELMARLVDVTREIGLNDAVVWGADMHLAVVKVLVHCGTMAGNSYFVANVLRSFSWKCDFLEVLYLEYRRAEEVEQWAELTKRALVWTARYDVAVSELLKQRIEDDYAIIKVQVRSFRELAIFQFRDVEEKRHARDPVNQLSNPFMDYVSHALPFPDRDTGYPDEYGDIGQWRAPGAPNTPTKGPGYYAPPMFGDDLRGYTAEWRDPKNPKNPPKLPNPWEKQYKRYAPGQHPSYDMVYAGPFPEIWPQRHTFRKPTRWDFFDIEKQSKFKINGPY